MTNRTFKKIYGLTFAELNKLVIGETTKLKASATKEELDKLNFDTLDGTSRGQCIYGQMTGCCFEPRAVTLIENSCERVFTAHFGTDLIEGVLNGSPKETRRKEYWSPIEIFIDQPRNKENGNNKKLVNFLKTKQPKLILL